LKEGDDVIILPSVTEEEAKQNTKGVEGAQTVSPDRSAAKIRAAKG
jgi:hypothetical protein